MENPSNLDISQKLTPFSKKNHTNSFYSTTNKKDLGINFPSSRKN